MSLALSTRSVVAAIPLTNGEVKRTDIVPDAAGAVVLVQDVHLNPDAQGNIAAILGSLVASRQAGVIGVEGAFNDFDFSPFRTGDPTLNRAAPVLGRHTSELLAEAGYDPARIDELRARGVLI